MEKENTVTFLADSLMQKRSLPSIILSVTLTDTHINTFYENIIRIYECINSSENFQGKQWQLQIFQITMYFASLFTRPSNIKSEIELLSFWKSLEGSTIATHLFLPPSYFGFHQKCSKHKPVYKVLKQQ